MAEMSTVYDLKELEQQLHSLRSRYIYNDVQADSRSYCSSFCKLVEHFASRWKDPLPQLRILERALCCFTQASAFFTVGCDHVLCTLSSLALSVFELLLFFDQKDFSQDPLRKITVAFQECCSSLARFQNVHLLLVERLLQAGGSWANQTLLAILSESTLPQTEVEGCISSEPPVFLELRVRYLLSCQRLSEAQALAKCCAQHPSVGQHFFFLKAYLAGLYKAAQHEHLLEEVADFSGKDAVNFICSLESEENDDVLLGLSRVFLSQQLHRGDMRFLCDLVSLWGTLHRRLKTSKDALLKECEQLILSATNVNAIFPFIRAIIVEANEDGVQFCMELCANALRSCPPCDVITKSLIYKTIAVLVPNDLEICRACALLVFFLERSVEAYKMVYILYMHPDQEYHVDCCPIGNRVRFETLQILKKDLYFDPEFWNLIALRTNCLKLMNEKVLSAALEEIMEEKWVPNYCLKETKSLSSRSKYTNKNGLNKVKTLKGEQQNCKDTADKAPARKVGRPRLNKPLPLKKKGNQDSKQWKGISSEPTRRSTLWQLDRVHCNRALDSCENRRTTRLSERVPAKRMIRTPKWLLEDSGTLERRSSGSVKRQYSFPYLPLRRRRRVVKNDTDDEEKFEENLKENQISDIKQEKETPPDSQTASTAPQVVLELSLPDNELLDTFTDEPCNRHRGLPQRVYYKRTLKVPCKVEPEKASFSNEVILKAQDTTSFILMLHCYSKRPKGKKMETNSHALHLSVARSSGPVDALNKEQLTEKPAVEMKVTISSQMHQETDKILKSSSEKLEETCTVPKETKSVIEPEVTREASSATGFAESTVEVEVQITQENKHSPRLEKIDKMEDISSIISENEHSPRLEKTNNTVDISSLISMKENSPRLEKANSTEDISNIISKNETSEEDGNQANDKLPQSSDSEESKPQETIVTNGEVLGEGTPSPEDDFSSTENSEETFIDPTVGKPIAESEMSDAQTATGNTCNLLSVTVEKESKTEIPQSQDEQKDTEQEDTAAVHTDPIVSKMEEDDSKSVPTSSLSSITVCEEDGFDPMEPQPECEESNLEFCCFFCHKDVKGRHLVAHAMFHYRKDECMFCGVAFKNNLKAMMHLSNHLEKLKKLQNPTPNNSPKQSRTKPKLNTTVNVETMTKEKKRRGRPPLSTVRQLRSGYRLKDRIKQEEDGAKDLRRKEYMQRVNGHIGKRKKRKDIDRNLIVKTRLRHRSNENHRNNEIKPVKIEKEKPLILSSEQKHEGKIKSKTSKQTDINKKTDQQEKLCCPVDGCTWSTVKKHAIFLYHVLENHYPDTKPLELAFRVANNSCSVCKRVLYSFEHFQHHVGRHRSVPRHPCPHKGCSARFKTTIEMRRHARKHSPLQAVCCLPGCPKLFICQWALILHEKDHFSKRSKATLISDEPKNTQAVVQQEKQEEAMKYVRSKEKVAPALTDKTPNDGNKMHSSAILKKDLSAQSAATRLLQRLRKRQITKNSSSQQMTLKSVSSVGKPNYKLRHSLQKRKNKAKEKFCKKVLPPRRAKSSPNNISVKNIMSEDESNKEKTPELHKKIKEGKKNTDGAKTKSTGKINARNQKVTKTPNTRTIERNLSTKSKEINKVKGTEQVRRKSKRVAPVDEENAKMDTTDATESTLVVRNKKGLKDSKKKMAHVQTPQKAKEVARENKICEISNPTGDAKCEDVQENNADVGAVLVTAVSSNAHSTDSVMEAAVTEVDLAPVMENSSEEKPDGDMLSKTEECEQESGAELEILRPEETTDSLENTPVSLPTFEKPNVLSQEMPEKDVVDSNEVSLSDSPVLKNVEENVASQQNAEAITSKHVSEASDRAIAQNLEDEADEVENSKAMTDKATSADDIDDVEYENTLKVTNKGNLEAEHVSILEKLESTDLDATVKTSQTEEPKESENVTTEETGVNTADNKSALANNSHSLNETLEPMVAQRFRPRFCCKSDILSALKSLVTSKNDKVKSKYEIKSSAMKRKNEQSKTSASKKLKPETQTRKDVAASADRSSVSGEKKATETTDHLVTNSSTPVNENITLEGKVRKVRKKSLPIKKKDVLEKLKTVKGKVQKKPKAASKNMVDKSTKKKRGKSEAKNAKSKPKDHKVEVKVSTKPDTPSPEVSVTSSNDVNSQSMPTQDDKQANVGQDLNYKDESMKKDIQMDKAETNPETPKAATVQKVKEPQEETCLKPKDVFNLVPEEEENPLSAFEKALNEYKKRPYMRLPATAYLEEKFTVMPKRRKDMSMYFGSSRKVQATPQQRQRCANCFSTFSSEEELQWHLQQKCSNLFGFDSDEEGTS